MAAREIRRVSSSGSETLRSFYPTDIPYYQQRRMLVHALTLPAGWLDKIGV
jgi:hypothetical protein